MFKYLNSRLKMALWCTGLLGALGARTDVIQINANLTGEVTWRSTNEYVLEGFIYVLKGSVLNIEPGTVIRGKAGTGLSSSALFITQGAKIFANGTRAKPIIFTSETDDLADTQDLPTWQRGLWGGLVIFGSSVLNTASDVAGNAAAISSSVNGRDCTPAKNSRASSLHIRFAFLLVFTISR